MRLLARRLAPHVQYKLREGQHCCARNNNIFDAASSNQDRGRCGPHPPGDLPSFTLIFLKFETVSYDCIYYILR
jgi:hypothetical protein